MRLDERKGYFGQPFTVVYPRSVYPPSRTLELLAFDEYCRFDTSASIRPPDHAESGGFTGPFKSTNLDSPGLWVHIYCHLVKIVSVHSVLIINLGCMYLCVIQMFAH